MHKCSPSDWRIRQAPAPSYCRGCWRPLVAAGDGWQHPAPIRARKVTGPDAPALRRLAREISGLL